jgi:1-acyl-sn-glycerol-3-phosphate acyltransferase
MLPALPNPLIQLWFNWYCQFTLRKFFHRVQLFGDVPFEPDRSTIYIANHCSFWDAIVLNHLIQTRRRQRAYCMSDAVQVARHPFFRRVGAFSVDRANPRDGMRAIHYAADLLNASPCSVVIFPQGKIEPADRRPIRFERGIERLIALAPAQIVLVALRYEFWLDQRAEALIDLSIANDRSVTEMEQQMTDRLDALACAGRAHRAGPTVLVKGRRSIADWTAIRAGEGISAPTPRPPADRPVRSDRV